MAHAKKYIDSLSEAEREQRESITCNYRYSQRERDRAQMLLLSEQGRSDQKIADKVGCHWMTVRNVRLRFCTQQTQRQQEVDQKPLVSVKRAHQVNRPKRAFDGEKEAQLIVVENVGKETIRRTLKKTNLNLGTRNAGAFLQPKTPAS